MRGKKKHDTTEEKLYEINETELPTEEWLEHITAFWEQVYQKHTNTLTEQWDPLKRELYSNKYKRNETIAEYRNSTIHIPYRLHEHYDMVAKVRYIGYMEDPHITTADVTQQIKKVKENKSAGPDGIKPDLLKKFDNDTHCINILTDPMKKIIQKENNLPASWYPSKDVLILIINIYSGDKTQLYFNNIHQQDINITSGISQGCNGSSSSFLLVIYLIKEKMYKCLVESTQIYAR